MRTERLDIVPHYSVGFHCKVCGREGCANWQAQDGDVFRCTHCGTEHTIVLRIEIRTKHTHRKVKKLTEPADNE